MRLLAGINRPAPACALLAGVLAVVLTVAGCGSGAPDAASTRLAPADLLLDPSDLPPGFTVTPFTVAELVDGNSAAIESAARMRVEPDFCRPTADAALNGQLRADNSAVLGARRFNTSLVELVSTARRDVGADLFATSAQCARTETTITAGNLAGARIVTEYAALPVPPVTGGLRTGERAVLVRSTVTTRLPDGGVRSQVGFAGYALLDRPASGAVTVQLTVSGEPTPATTPPTPAPSPLTDAQFVDLFGRALAQATADGH